MFGLLKKNPQKALEKTIEAKLAKARDVQRSGDLRAYAALIEEIEELQKQLDQA